MRQLIDALEPIRQRLRELSDMNPEDLQLRDAPDMILILQKVLEGKNVLRAFGAPGDWGYGTPMGKGVMAALRAQAEST